MVRRVLLFLALGLNVCVVLPLFAGFPEIGLWGLISVVNVVPLFGAWRLIRGTWQRRGWFRSSLITIVLVAAALVLTALVNEVTTDGAVSVLAGGGPLLIHRRLDRAGRLRGWWTGILGAAWRLVLAIDAIAVTGLLVTGIAYWEATHR